MKPGLARLAVVLASAPLLGGCVAAAVPLVAGGLVARQQVNAPGPQTPAPPPSERVSVFIRDPVFTTGLTSSAVSVPAVTVAAAPSAAPPAAIPASVDSPGLTAVATAAPPPAAVTAAIPAPAESAGLAATASAAPLPAAVAAPALALPVPANPIAAIGPAPADAADPASWAAFARYAVTRAPPPPPGTARRSALVDQATIVGQPKLEQCGRQPPAVVIDLDPGQEPINLDDPPTPAPGLADALAGIRNIGVTVLWLTAHPTSAENRIRRLLRAVELDEGGVDKLLLLRNPGDRKQARRSAATRDWCILAIAGDRRGDFDELFDYLLDTASPTATALEPVFGDGWFLAPPPIG